MLMVTVTSLLPWLLGPQRPSRNMRQFHILYGNCISHCYSSLPVVFPTANAYNMCSINNGTLLIMSYAGL